MNHLQVSSPTSVVQGSFTVLILGVYVSTFLQEAIAESLDSYKEIRGARNGDEVDVCVLELANSRHFYDSSRKIDKSSGAACFCLDSYAQQLIGSETGVRNSSEQHEKLELQPYKIHAPEHVSRLQGK